jgi:hypothetical protein
MKVPYTAGQEINVTYLPAGSYFFRIMDDRGKQLHSGRWTRE